MDNPLLIRNVAVVGNIHHGSIPRFECIIHRQDPLPGHANRDNPRQAVEPHQGSPVHGHHDLRAGARHQHHLDADLAPPERLQRQELAAEFRGHAGTHQPHRRDHGRAAHRGRLRGVRGRGGGRHAEHRAVHSPVRRAEHPHDSRLHQDGSTHHRPQNAARRRLLQAGRHARRSPDFWNSNSR